MKPTAVICDIDGTLAHMTNRGPYDTSKYADDSKDDLVHELFSALTAHGATRLIVSGRSEDFRDVTEQWLEKHGITYSHLFMRPSGDIRNDRVVKRELYEQYIKPHYTVKCVIDDRNRVVDMWRNELNLICLQVADGDF